MVHVAQFIGMLGLFAQRDHLAIGLLGRSVGIMGNNQETIGSSCLKSCNSIISGGEIREHEATVAKCCHLDRITVIARCHDHIIEIEAQIPACAAEAHGRAVLDVFKHDDILLCHPGQLNHLLLATTRHNSGTAVAA